MQKLNFKAQNRPVAFVIAATNHGTMLVNRNDFMEINNEKHGVGFHLLNESSFDSEEVNLALQIITEKRKYYGDGVVAIDCGANIGVHTIEWAKHMHEWGEVIAIEPQERIYYALAGNITLNNCFNARALWMAVGEKVGTIMVPQPDYLKPGSFGSLELKISNKNEFIGQVISYNDSDMLETNMISIDELRLNRLDFIKVDVEGMEIEVLKGSMTSLVKNRPCIIIEKIKSNSQNIRSLLESLGYGVTSVGINFLGIHKEDRVFSNFRNYFHYI